MKYPYTVVVGLIQVSSVCSRDKTRLKLRTKLMNINFINVNTMSCF